jgi:hypothetical protein
MSSKARGDVRMKTFGGRPCAVFEYCGDAMNVTDARRLVLSDLG